MQCKNRKKAKKIKILLLSTQTQKIKVQNSARTKLTQGWKRVKIQHGGQGSISRTRDEDQKPTQGTRIKIPDEPPFVVRCRCRSTDFGQ